jgi:hypothetical protein
MNALKDGLFSIDVLGGILNREDPQEYKALQDELRRYHEPVDIDEELTVRWVGACYWRLDRGWRSENASVTSA